MCLVYVSPKYTKKTYINCTLLSNFLCYSQVGKFYLCKNENNMSPDPGTFLENINSPADLKKLREEELPVLCSEIRQFIIDVISANPGHLAASLGAVEMAVAIHYVFDTPHDKLI